MRTLFAVTVLSLSVLTFAASPSYAGCSCSKKCMTSCKKGESKHCKCKSCDCSKNHKCGHDEGQCKAPEPSKT